MALMRQNNLQVYIFNWIFGQGRRYSACEFKIRAAMAPGTQPASVSSATIITVPQPRSKTASGGKMIHNNARVHPIDLF